MPEPEQPRYSEAYPRFSISQAKAKVGTERRILLWRNQDNHAIGTLRFEWEADQRLTLKPRIQDLPYCDGSTADAELDISREVTGYGRSQYFTICPRCGQRIDIVIYCDGYWQCSKCHGLRNRSSLLDRVIRISIELGALEDEVGNGRPFRMRQKSYDAKLERLQELAAALGKQPRRVPDRRFRFNVSGSWEAETDSLLYFESGFARGLSW